MLTPYRSPDALDELHPSAFPEVPAAFPEPEEEGINWARIVAALLRHKWLILLLSALGATAGVVATRFLPPEYQVGATVFIAGSNRTDDRGGPIRADALLQATAWVELIRSFAVVDPVVRRMGLFVLPRNPRDSALFNGLQLGAHFRPGHYTLELDPHAKRYQLKSNDALVESGAIGDSIGRHIGILWRPAADALQNRGSTQFELITPREASVKLNDNLVTFLPEQSSFLRMRLSGSHSQLTAATLNEWLREYISVAAEMKKAKMSELTEILGVQLAYADSLLKRSEVALEAFRVAAITKPTEGSPLAAGVEATRDPVMQNFFSAKIAYETTHRQRESLEKLLAQLQQRAAPPQALFALPLVLNGAPELRAALEELQTKQAALRNARQFYTEENKTVRDLRTAVENLEGATIPKAVAIALDNLRQQEQDLNDRISSSSQELQQIPARTIEEMGLRREVAVADNLYRTLQSRYAEARLAEASATPDIAVLDSAVAPQHPENSKAWRLILMAALASIGLALAVALASDHLDRRIRYPEQATGELKLPIVGTIPALFPRRGKSDPLAGAQVVESFRALRLQLQHLNGRSPIVLTVSSPGAGDGKSLLSANLALSFADAGYRALLVDGDIRRGMQHTVLGASVQPGLLNYLSGQVGIEQILQKSPHEKLTFISRGTRVQGGPELLVSRAMAELMTQLPTRFDAIIIDSPPLSAGIDPLALAVHSRNLLIVLRVGETDRKLALAKLQLVKRLPIRVIGAVLNEVRAEGVYRYYSYDYGDPGFATAGSLGGGLVEVASAAGRV